MRKQMFHVVLQMATITFFITSCHKEIDNTAAKQLAEETSSANPNSLRGHLVQTKTYSSEVVVKWLDLQWRVFPTTQEQDSGLGFVPTRFYAYCGIGLYESVMQGMPAYQSLSGQLINMPLMAETQPGMAYHWPTCANTVLAWLTKHFLPNISVAKKASIDSLEGALNATYQTEVSASIFQRSVEFGKIIAQDIYTWSITDGFYAEYPIYVPPVGPGLWVPTAPGFLPTGPLSHTRHLRLFMPGLLTENALQPPIPYSTDQSSAFFRSIKEVYDASIILTPEQRAQADYWRGVPIGSAAAQWFNILRKILIEQGNAVMLDEAVLTYCKTGIVLSDAATSCFKETFMYNQLRPITYIRDVMGHTTWNSLFPTVPYPAYPDFHATIAASSAAVLTLMFGNNYQFNTNGTHHLGLPGYSFNSFDEAAIHAGNSRIYAGVNSMPSINAALWLGNKTAEYMNSHIRFLK